MSSNFKDSNRQAVPRWRPFKIAAELELMEPVRSSMRTVPEPRPGELEEIANDFASNRTLIHAADLVDAALVAERPDIGRNAAEFIIDNEPARVSARLAAALLGKQRPALAATTPPALSNSDRYVRIAQFRRVLRITPHDVIKWVDLAREYATLGQNEAALQALRIAINLAPQNRFVLRAANRFFLHIGEFGKAHDIVRRAATVETDPWILAAEIASAEIAERQSRFVKTAQRLLQNKNIAPRHLSELASVVGTLEHGHGDRAKVRKLFAVALADPTENAVAQAGWVSRHMPAFEIPAEKLNVPRAFEAKAWEHFLDGRARAATDLSREWLRDEPFATRPALFGSWVASTAIGDFPTAIEFAEAARFSNPGEPSPMAQLVFCYATQARFEEARQLLKALPDAIREHPDSMSQDEWEIFREANLGLIAFRGNDVETGRSHYNMAIAKAVESGKRQMASNAFMYFLREEARVDRSAAEQYLPEAKRIVDNMPLSIRPAYARLLERIISGHIE